MEKLRTRFVERLEQLNKEADAAEVERGLERLKELKAKSPDIKNLTEEEQEEWDNLSDTIPTEVSNLILKDVASNVESHIDETVSSLYKAIPKSPADELVKDIADGIITDLSTGKKSSLKESIDSIWETYYDNIDEWIQKFWKA